MNIFTKELSKLQKEVKDRMSETRKIISGMEEMFSDSELLVPDKVCVYPYSVIFIINNISELTELRRMLKQVIPEYTDKLEYIGPYYGDLGTAQYTIRSGNKVSPASISLVAPVNNFPVKLNEGCGFKKTERTYTDSRWEYSCDNK